MSSYQRNTAGMTVVSDRLRKRVDRDFQQPGCSEQALRLLADVSASERVQAAIIFAADGDFEELKRGAALALTDWRDVLVNGGLAHEDWREVLAARLGPDPTA